MTGRRDFGQEIAEELGARFVQCDVSAEPEVISSYEAVTTQSEKLDIVVLNAGIAPDTLGLEATESRIMEEILATNVLGVYFGLKHAPRHMNDNSSIIISGSAAGSGTTLFGYGEYSASKAAAAWLGRTAAIEYANRGIRVNTVCPASIAGTGMMYDDDGSPEARLNASFTAFGPYGDAGRGGCALSLPGERCQQLYYRTGDCRGRRNDGRHQYPYARFAGAACRYSIRINVMILGFSHPGIVVPDIEKARKFYERMFGIPGGQLRAVGGGQ